MDDPLLRKASQDSHWSLRDALPQVEPLANGSLVLTLAASHGSATDPASLENLEVS
jgi:hypothetical protein